MHKVKQTTANLVWH